MPYKCCAGDRSDPHSLISAPWTGRINSTWPRNEMRLNPEAIFCSSATISKEVLASQPSVKHRWWKNATFCYFSPADAEIALRRTNQHPTTSQQMLPGSYTLLYSATSTFIFQSITLSAIIFLSCFPVCHYSRNMQHLEFQDIFSEHNIVISNISILYTMLVVTTSSLHTVQLISLPLRSTFNRCKFKHIICKC